MVGGPVAFRDGEGDDGSAVLVEPELLEPAVNVCVFAQLAFVHAVVFEHHKVGHPEDAGEVFWRGLLAARPGMRIGRAGELAVEAGADALEEDAAALELVAEGGGGDGIGAEASEGGGGVEFVGEDAGVEVGVGVGGEEGGGPAVYSEERDEAGGGAEGVVCGEEEGDMLEDLLGDGAEGEHGGRGGDSGGAVGLFKDGRCEYRVFPIHYNMAESPALRCLLTAVLLSARTSQDSPRSPSKASSTSHLASVTPSLFSELLLPLFHPQIPSNLQPPTNSKFLLVPHQASLWEN